MCIRDRPTVIACDECSHSCSHQIRHRIRGWEYTKAGGILLPKMAWHRFFRQNRSQQVLFSRAPLFWAHDWYCQWAVYLLRQLYVVMPALCGDANISIEESCLLVQLKYSWVCNMQLCPLLLSMAIWTFLQGLIMQCHFVHAHDCSAEVDCRIWMYVLRKAKAMLVAYLDWCLVAFSHKPLQHHWVEV